MFSAYHVASPDEIQETMDLLIKGSEDGEPQLWSVLFLNCGATLDVRQMCQLQKNQFIRCIVIDHHRPIHHSYNEVEDQSAMLLLDTEEEGIEVDDIPTIDSNFHQPHSQENDPEGGRSRKRQRLCLENERELYYMNGAMYGKSSALVVYEISTLVNAQNRTGLWNAIVGVTDMLVHHRLSSEKYQEYFNQLEREVVASTPEGRGRRSSGLISKPKNQEIRTEDDFHIPLYRHQKLYDALHRSLYVAPRLDTFREKGESKLIKLVHEVGVPLQLAKQNVFTMLKCQHQKLFRSQLLKKKDSNYLSDVVFQSFFLRDGYEVRMSAQDMALLLQTIISKSVRQQSERKKHFTTAQHVGSNDYSKAMKSAIELQRRLHKLCGSIVENKLCTLRKRVWYVDMTGNIEGRDTLNHPQSLTRACYCIHETYQRISSKNFPVIIVSPASLDRICLVTGLQYAEPHKPNKFSFAFEKAAETLEPGTWSQCGFSKCFYFVSKDSISKFVNQTIIELNSVTPVEAEEEEGEE